jgi:biopolymer transport protein ExbD
MKNIIVIALLAVFAGCGGQQTPEVIVDAHDFSPVVITKDGQLMFESKPMTQTELVEMVKERVERDMVSTARSQYSTIILEPDPETPFEKVREIQDLIMKHGGNPGSERKEKP